MQSTDDLGGLNQLSSIDADEDFEGILGDHNAGEWEAAVEAADEQPRNDGFDGGFDDSDQLNMLDDRSFDQEEEAKEAERAINLIAYDQEKGKLIITTRSRLLRER